MINNDELMALIEIMRPTWDHHTDQIFIKDLDFRYVYVNPKYLEMANLTLDRVINKTGFEIFSNTSSPQNKEFERADYQVVQEGKTIEYEAIFYVDDEKMNSRTIKSPIINTKQKIIGIYGISRNIEFEIEMRSNLRQNYQLLETIMDTVPYPIFIKDLNSVYVKTNKAYNDTSLNENNPTVIGKNDIEFYGEELGQFLMSKDQLVLSSGERQFYLVNFNNRTSMTIKEPLRDHEGNITGIVGITNPFVDISELQDRIIGHEKIESLSALAGGIAHDLKNLLTLIMGYSDLLSRRLSDNDELSMAMSIKNASDRSVKLIERLLAFTKESHGKWKEIDLRHLVEESVILVQANLPRYITIHRNYSNEPAILLADETQITQLILNLLVNAIEAIKDKYFDDNVDADDIITITVDQKVITDISDSDYILQPSDFIPGNYIQLQVADTGPGISSNEIGKIFDPFYTTKPEGTGLGLSVIYGVISTHRGLIKLTSDIDIGTVFSIFLPVKI